jgi:hypothetical protein
MLFTGVKFSSSRLALKKAEISVTNMETIRFPVSEPLMHDNIVNQRNSVLHEL